MRLITITDRQNTVHHININFIVRIEIQKDGTVTIWDVNKFNINTNMDYVEFSNALADHS
jgi:hypothetical protein